MFKDDQFKAWVEALPAKLPDDVFTLQQVAKLHDLTSQELLFILACEGAGHFLKLRLLRSNKGRRSFTKRQVILAEDLPAIATMVAEHRELHSECIDMLLSHSQLIED